MTDNYVKIKQEEYEELQRFRLAASKTLETKELKKDNTKEESKDDSGMIYKIVPIRILTVGCPGIKHKDESSKIDDLLSEDEEEEKFEMDPKAKDERAEDLQLEGVVTDIANVNQFIKKYDKSIHSILGGPFQFDVKLSSGSILDCYITTDTVLERVKTVFQEARADLQNKQKGATNTGTVFIYFSGHGHYNRLIFHGGSLWYRKLYAAMREEIVKQKETAQTEQEKKCGLSSIIKIQLVIDACHSGSSIDEFDPRFPVKGQNTPLDELEYFSDLACNNNKEIILKIFASSKRNQKSYDMKIERGGAFTEFLFNDDKLEYWQRKWFGREDNPEFEHENKPQNSVSMDAIFWSDGDISLTIDNEKIINSKKIYEIKEDPQLQLPPSKKEKIARK